MSSTQNHSHAMDEFPIRVRDRWGNEVEVSPSEGQVSISVIGDVANFDLDAADELTRAIAHARALAAVWPTLAAVCDPPDAAAEDARQHEVAERVARIMSGQSTAVAEVADIFGRAAMNERSANVGGSDR